MNFFKRLFGKKDAAPKEPLIFILLLSAPKALERDDLEGLARKAWLADFGPNNDRADFVYSGTPDSGFVLSPHGNAFIVFPLLRGVRMLTPPAQFPSTAAATAWASHTADVSIGIVHRWDKDEAKLRRYLTRLTAELIDGDCLALLHPASGRLVPADSTLAQQLRENPAQYFS